MSLASPYLLVGLAAVPLLAVAYWLYESRRRARAASWSNTALLPNIVDSPPRRLRHVPIALFLIGLTLLLVGFARPKREVVHTRSYAPPIVLVFDVSGSMAASDVDPTRLAVARKVALRFLDRLPSSYRVGAVSFGDNVRVLAAPTNDRATVRSHLPRTITPKAGTSLGDAINAAVSVVIDAAGDGVAGSNHPGLIVVLSDGSQTAGGTTPASAADTAVVQRVPVDTVTIGTPNGSVTQPMVIDGFKTKVRIPVPAAPAAMRSVSEQTSGSTYSVETSSQAAVAAQNLARIEQTLNASRAVDHRVQDLSRVLGGVALVLIVSGIVLSGALFGRIA